MLHRSVSAVIWSLPFCPSPFLPHISATYSLVRRAGCTFSARSISLGWLIQFSKSFCERFLLCTPYTNRNPQGLFGIQFSKKILKPSEKKQKVKRQEKRAAGKPWKWQMRARKRQKNICSWILCEVEIFGWILKIMWYNAIEKLYGEILPGRVSWAVW